MMQMPQPQEEHRKLAAMAGSWVGEETIHPTPWDPAGGPAKGRIEARIDLDGFYVVSDYVQERGGQIVFRGHGVYGWNPHEKCYTMDWFDTMGSGSMGPARGTWSGNTLTFTRASPMGHGRYTYTFESSGRTLFRIENSQDGKTWAPFMDAVYVKTK